MKMVARKHARIGAGGWSVVAEVLVPSPPQVIPATGSLTMLLTIPGAALGDLALVSATTDLKGLDVTAYVSAADSVFLRVRNSQSFPVDLADAQWHIKVIH